MCYKKDTVFQWNACHTSELKHSVYCVVLAWFFALLYTRIQHQRCSLASILAIHKAALGLLYDIVSQKLNGSWTPKICFDMLKCLGRIQGWFGRTP